MNICAKINISNEFAVLLGPGAIGADFNSNFFVHKLLNIFLSIS